MRDEMLGYYERELTFLRQMGSEFSDKYPKIAGRLLLEQNQCEDPHVERMIEAFAFLASTDHLMPRAFEDAVEAGLIDVTKLPQAAQGRYSARQAARARLAASAG